MVSFAAAATPSLPPKPPDPDLDVVVPVDPPEPPVPPDPPPVLVVFLNLSSNLLTHGFFGVIPAPDLISGFTNLYKSLVFGLISIFSYGTSEADVFSSQVSFCFWPSSVALSESSELVAVGQIVVTQIVSTFMASCGLFVALVRPPTAVCSLRSVYALTASAVMSFPSYLWHIGKRNYIICFSIVIQICWGFHSLVYSFKEFNIFSFLSLCLSDGLTWSQVSIEVFHSFSSLMNYFSDAKDSSVLKGFSSGYYDLLAIVAEFLPMMAAQVVVISKLVCKSDCQELIHLLSESWSTDVHWILLAIRSLILSFNELVSYLVFGLACSMAKFVTGYAFLFCNISSFNGV